MRALSRQKAINGNGTWPSLPLPAETAHGLPLSAAAAVSIVMDDGDGVADARIY